MRADARDRENAAGRRGGARAVDRVEVARLFGLAALVVAGCGEDVPRESARPPEPAPTTRVEAAPRSERPRLGMARERCELGEARTLERTIPPGRSPRGAIAVAAHREASSALVVIDAAEPRDVVELWWPDPRSETVSHGAFVGELEAGSLFALEMTGPDTALLLRTSDCVEAGHAAVCLSARAIDLERERGEVRTSDPVRVAMPSAPSTLRVVATDGRVLVARSHAGASPALDTFFVEGPSVRATTRVLGEGLDLERGGVEILAVAASGGSHAVVFRQGAQEASDSTVTLSTALDEHAVPELREALVIESVAIFAGAIVMVAAFEFAEPSWLRLGFDGELLGEPRPLPAGESVPIPFADRRVARVDASGPITIEIRDGAGHATAPRVVLDPSVRAADLARFDGGFLLATIEEDARAHVASLRCRETALEAPRAADDNARTAQ